MSDVPWPRRFCRWVSGFGTGKPWPRNFTSFEAMKGMPYQSMYTAIKDGIPFSGMPSFSLNDKQIDEVIFYARSFLNENYITISTCLNIPQVVSLDNIDTGGTFDIEKDKPEFITTSLKAGEITLTPNFQAMRKEFNEKRSKLVRVFVNLAKTTQDNKK